MCALCVVYVFLCFLFSKPISCFFYSCKIKNQFFKMSVKEYFYLENIFTKHFYKINREPFPPPRPSQRTVSDSCSHLELPPDSSTESAGLSRNKLEFQISNFLSNDQIQSSRIE